MRKLNLVFMFSLVILSMACKKEGTTKALPDGSISFDLPATSDVIVYDPIDITKNVTMTFELTASLKGSTSTDDHNVTFAVDTSKIAGYIAKYGTTYGAARVLPTGTYLFYKPMVKLAAGETKSEAAQLNFAQQKTLKSYTTYVLPLVIKAVDGKTDGPATGRVIYYVIKTGAPEFVENTGWTITASSQNSAANAPSFAFDANLTTSFWRTPLTGAMPQWIMINFNKEIEFSAVVYYFPTSLTYPTLGGYPSSIQIETSIDGTTWTSRGIFPGNLVKEAEDPTFKQILDMGGKLKARYVRFTVLSVVKFVSGSSLYDSVAISSIFLKP